ncbi:hypothetical protein Tco_1274977 [Tanacetum coccineum]
MKIKPELEAGSSTLKCSKTIQSKNKGIVAKTYDWDGEEVTSYDEELDEVKMIKDVKVFAHVNLDEYIHVALLEGLTIAGKERLALIGDTGLRALEASKWNIVGLWRLIERDKTLTKDLLGLKMRSTKSRLCSGGSTATTGYARAYLVIHRRSVKKISFLSFAEGITKSAYSVEMRCIPSSRLPWFSSSSN